MVIAVPIKVATAPQGKPGLGISFGIEFHQLHPVTGNKGKEGNGMGLCHRMGDGNKIFVLHRLQNGLVFGIRLFCLQDRQGNAAAAYDAVAGAVEQIATDRTHIKFGAEQVGGDVFVCNMLPVHQFN